MWAKNLIYQQQICLSTFYYLTFALYFCYMLFLIVGLFFWGAWTVHRLQVTPEMIQICSKLQKKRLRLGPALSYSPAGWHAHVGFYYLLKCKFIGFSRYKWDMSNFLKLLYESQSSVLHLIYYYNAQIANYELFLD